MANAIKKRKIASSFLFLRNIPRTHALKAEIAAVA
jgi:hypothetical protein